MKWIQLNLEQNRKVIRNLENFNKLFWRVYIICNSDLSKSLVLFLLLAFSSFRRFIYQAGLEKCKQKQGEPVCSPNSKQKINDSIIFGRKSKQNTLQGRKLRPSNFTLGCCVLKRFDGKKRKKLMWKYVNWIYFFENAVQREKIVHRGIDRLHSHRLRSRAPRTKTTSEKFHSDEFRFII